jgi:hypothetical protein
MSVLKKDLGKGGARLTPDRNDGDNLRQNLVDLQADYAELRAQFVALLAKLDGDSGVNQTNYAATLTPAAVKLTVEA